MTTIEKMRKAGLLPPKELEKLPKKGLNFIKYEIIRRDGIINMGDVHYGTKMTGMTKEEWFDIMFNYYEYAKKYMKYYRPEFQKLFNPSA